MEEKSIASNTELRWNIKTLIDVASQYDSVLDVGCGTGSTIKQIQANVRIGIDVCLKAIIVAGRNNNGVIFMCKDLKEFYVADHFKVDCVIGVDIIEHFEKDYALKLLETLEQTATKRLIFFIPVGNHPQTKDDRGFKNDHFQTHRSTWYPEDMKRLGYQVWAYPNWHKNILPPKEKGAMWCQKILG